MQLCNDVLGLVYVYKEEFERLERFNELMLLLKGYEWYLIPMALRLWKMGIPLSVYDLPRLIANFHLKDVYNVIPSHRVWFQN